MTAYATATWSELVRRRHCLDVDAALELARRHEQAILSCRRGRMGTGAHFVPSMDLKLSLVELVYIQLLSHELRDGAELAMAEEGMVSWEMLAKLDAEPDDGARRLAGWASHRLGRLRRWEADHTGVHDVVGASEVREGPEPVDGWATDAVGVGEGTRGMARAHEPVDTVDPLDDPEWITLVDVLVLLNRPGSRPRTRQRRELEAALRVDPVPALVALHRAVGRDRQLRAERDAIREGLQVLLAQAELPTAEWRRAFAPCAVTGRVALWLVRHVIAAGSDSSYGSGRAACRVLMGWGYPDLTERVGEFTTELRTLHSLASCERQARVRVLLGAYGSEPVDVVRVRRLNAVWDALASGRIPPRPELSPPEAVWLAIWATLASSLEPGAVLAAWSVDVDADGVRAGALRLHHLARRAVPVVRAHLGAQL